MKRAVSSRYGIGDAAMSNPGLGMCKNCHKPIERADSGTAIGLVWIHRDSASRRCIPTQRFSTMAEKR
jgi:hypothetical protein